MPITETKQDLSESPLFGLWQDREDCQDVEAYVDDLRQERFSCSPLEFELV